MDVILDSNQYVDDPRMERAEFQSLLDYLRITGDSLVVPRIVRDEVIARCEDDLRKEHSRSVTALRNLRRRVFKLAVPADPQDPDYAEEARLLEQRLGNPAPGVTSAILPDYSEIDTAEVARRGIFRIKPASTSGEELRDVMLWLATVGYAKNSKSKIGFISSDGGFHVSKDDKNLNPELKAELDREGIELVFAATIGDFVKGQIPKRTAVTAGWVTAHLSPGQIADITQLFKYGIANLLQGSILSAGSDPALSFKSGVRYEVSQETQFVELEYEGSWELTLGPKFEVPPTPYTVPSSTATASQVPPLFIEETKRGHYQGQPWAGAATAATVHTWQTSVNPFAKTISEALSSASKTTLLSASFPVSFRVVNDTLGRPEVDLRKFRAIGS